jgi:hypothetical protein
MAYIGNTAEQQAFTPRVDYFSGNASATAFTLSFPVASVAQVQAVIENVPQNPGDAYTVSGNTITFTSAPPSGTNNIYVYYTSPITQVIQPGQGTVGTAQIQDSAITTAKIAAEAVVEADLANSAVTTVKIANAAVTPAKLSQPLTSDTAKASTSGTSIDFTGIPSWVKRITVMFAGVSTNGSSIIQIQLGDAGGFEITGYLGGGGLIQNVSSSQTANFTSGFGITGAGSAAAVYHGSMVLTLLSSNQWVANGSFARSDVAVPNFGQGSKTLSDTLTQVRITTVNGTDTFDAGSINILYE